jgi:predicted PurR-regulated permease PerM
MSHPAWAYRTFTRAADEYEEKKGMKRTAAALVAMLLVVLLAAGPALAVLPVILGTDHAEQLKGTNDAEEIRSLGGCRRDRGRSG